MVSDSDSEKKKWSLWSKQIIYHYIYIWPVYNGWSSNFFKFLSSTCCWIWNLHDFLLFHLYIILRFLSHCVLIQGVLDYQDREFIIPGLIKYSIYRSNSSIIRISILGILVPKLSIFRLLGNLFWAYLVNPIIEDPLYRAYSHNIIIAIEQFGFKIWLKHHYSQSSTIVWKMHELHI